MKQIFLLFLFTAGCFNAFGQSFSIINKWSSKGEKNLVHEWTFSNDSSFRQSIWTIGKRDTISKTGRFNLKDSILIIKWNDGNDIIATIKFTNANKIEVTSPDKGEKGLYNIDIYRREE